MKEKKRELNTHKRKEDKDRKREKACAGEWLQQRKKYIGRGKPMKT